MFITIDRPDALIGPCQFSDCMMGAIRGPQAQLYASAEVPAGHFPELYLL